MDGVLGILGVLVFFAKETGDIIEKFCEGNLERGVFIFCLYLLGRWICWVMAFQFNLLGSHLNAQVKHLDAAIEKVDSRISQLEYKLNQLEK